MDDNEKVVLCTLFVCLLLACFAVLLYFEASTESEFERCIQACYSTGEPTHTTQCKLACIEAFKPCNNTNYTIK